MGSHRMLRLIVVAATLDFVLGHGNMFHPPAWWDRDSKLRTPASRGCGVLNLGKHNEFSEHHGGKDPDCMPYWYRLCKMPHGGIKDVTEECFQQTPLEFEGEDQWVVYRADAHSGHRTRVSANRTTEGTFPPGSMWTMNPLFPAVETDPADHEHGQGEVIDYVKVPETLEPGLYILGFRWDCKCSPQVSDTKELWFATEGLLTPWHRLQPAFVRVQWSSKQSRLQQPGQKTRYHIILTSSSSHNRKL